MHDVIRRETIVNFYLSNIFNIFLNNYIYVCVHLSMV